ncbi:ZrgA family zinc uptake protein [Piscinibacter sakaiensis]|uniref:ZrgA family zinc uptake protein n=1 Tax=Piscinibacter sakaiensis TaxID=1547922 RepID=UPI003AAB3873
MLTVRRSIACALAALPLLGIAGQAHVHGAAKLDIAIDARTLVIALDSPLDNLLGFERAPRSAAERSKTDEMVARLKAGTPFRIDPQAGCRLAHVDLVSAVLQLGSQPAAAAGHADLRASFEFQCEAAERAGHVDVELFGHPHMQRIDVQIAGPTGQFKQRLTKSARRVQLAR